MIKPLVQLGFVLQGLVADTPVHYVADRYYIADATVRSSLELP